MISNEDQLFLQAFEELELPAEQFKHRNHLRLAWLLLQLEADYELTFGRLAEGIRRYATHLGVPDLYHATLTDAMLRLVDERQRSGLYTTWQQLLEAHPELLSQGKELVAARYSTALLDSFAARQQVLPPDLQ
ncbi:hypothetical protein WH50_18025 [Pokkaliibacter plantistimulans]|uniref:Uncharacterized protein n=1 Tax=Pokkaliibacter plantistimulans TaxID=1635171 RepID=A0ABX5LZ32_9GAMM|nr:hypothetical protein [Pokkaliibacter plantistimulans]PXF29940.1 hypothetical protein WH50_18025 [Pokkaliibacter plantistimulans]